MFSDLREVSPPDSKKFLDLRPKSWPFPAICGGDGLRLALWRRRLVLFNLLREYHIISRREGTFLI